LASELAETYPECVRRLVGILTRIPALDAQVAHVNGHAPPGVRARLQKVEQTARGVDGFGPNGLLSLMSDMMLPKFRFEGGDRYQFFWPPPQPSLIAQMVQAGGLAVPQGGVFGPDWHDALDERDRRRREESERLSEFYEKREREAEERREAELREAHRREYGY